jgi:hypothetical protein
MASSKTRFSNGGERRVIFRDEGNRARFQELLENMVGRFALRVV